MDFVHHWIGVQGDDNAPRTPHPALRTTHSAQRTPHSPTWRDAILNDFVPNVSKLTLVADPDCLLTEEKLALELRGRGFDLIDLLQADRKLSRLFYGEFFHGYWGSNR